MQSTIRAVSQAIILLAGAAWLPPRTAAAARMDEDACPKPPESCGLACDRAKPFPGCTVPSCDWPRTIHEDGSCTISLVCNYNC